MKSIIFSASILIIILCVLRWMFRKKIKPVLQYAMWILVILRLIPFSMIPGIQIHTVESEFSSMNLYESAVDYAKTTIQQNKEAATKQELESTPMIEEERVDNKENQRVIWEFIKEHQSEILFGVWMAGAIIVAVLLFASNVKFRKQLLKKRTLLEIEHSFLPIYIVEGLKTPCIYMIHGKNAIYVSPEVAGNEEELRYVLLHEYCHYRHLDHIWTIVRCILLIGYWFHPLVWVSAILSKQDGEIACDATAIQDLEKEERISYGRTLLNLATKDHTSMRYCFGNAMAENKKGLKERIVMIVKQPRMKLATFFLFGVLLGGAIVSTFTNAKIKEQSHEAMVSNQKQEESITPSISKEAEVTVTPSISKEAEITPTPSGEESKTNKNDFFDEDEFDWYDNEDETEDEDEWYDNEDEAEDEDEDEDEWYDNFGVEGFVGGLANELRDEIREGLEEGVQNNLHAWGIRELEHATVSTVFYYTNGDAVKDFWDRNKEICGMKDITEDVIPKTDNYSYNGYSFTPTTKRYHFKLNEFTGIHHVLMLEVSEEASFVFDIEGTVENQDFKLAFQHEDGSVEYLKLNDKTTLQLKKGEHYIVLCGYNTGADLLIGIDDVK